MFLYLRPISNIHRTYHNYEKTPLYTLNAPHSANSNASAGYICLRTVFFNHPARERAVASPLRPHKACKSRTIQRHSMAGMVPGKQNSPRGDAPAHPSPDQCRHPILASAAHIGGRHPHALLLRHQRRTPRWRMALHALSARFRP